MNPSPESSRQLLRPLGRMERQKGPGHLEGLATWAGMIPMDTAKSVENPWGFWCVEWIFHGFLDMFGRYLVDIIDKIRRKTRVYISFWIYVLSICPSIENRVRWISGMCVATSRGFLNELKMGSIWPIPRTTNGPSPRPTTKVNKPRRLLASSIPPRRDASTAIRWVLMLDSEEFLRKMDQWVFRVVCLIFASEHLGSLCAFCPLLYYAQECRPVGTPKSDFKTLDPLPQSIATIQYGAKQVSTVAVWVDGKWWKVF